MTTLRQGDRGPAVLELQALLAMTGHDPGPLDGVFGPRTLRAFEAWYSLPEALTSVTDDDLAALRALSRRAVELPRILTPIAAVDMRIALAAGYHATDPVGAGYERIEDMPGAGNAVRVALAQLAVEHGCRPWSDGLVMRQHLPPTWLCPQPAEQAYLYVWDFDIGNRQIRREDGPMVPWFSMSPVEGSGATAHKVMSAHYAYPNAAEGAAAYWRFLRDHCASALAAFERGDPAAAAKGLKHGGWGYSGDEEAYTRGMVDRFRGIE